MAPEMSQTLDRGLRLLRLLADQPDGLSPTQAGVALGLSRPVVYRLLTTLQEHGFVRRSADGRLHVGFGVLQISAAVQPVIRDAALPVLRELAEETGATAHLTVAEGDEAVAIAVVEPVRVDVHVAYRVGSRHPLERGAAGLAILAARRGEDRCVTSEGHLQAGAYGIAAPVPHTVDIDAGLGVVSLTPFDVAATEPVVKAAAVRLSTALR